MRCISVTVPAEELVVGDVVDLGFSDRVYSTATVVEVKRHVNMLAMPYTEAVMYRPYLVFSHLTGKPEVSYESIRVTEAEEETKLLGKARLFSVIRRYVKEN